MSSRYRPPDKTTGQVIYDKNWGDENGQISWNIAVKDGRLFGSGQDSTAWNSSSLNGRFSNFYEIDQNANIISTKKIDVTNQIDLAPDIILTDGGYVITGVSLGADGSNSKLYTDLKALKPSANESFAEYGSVSVNHTWQDVALSLDYISPVVIISDPTYKGGDPTVVRLKNIDSDSFQIKLQEPKYKDGRHVNETISYVVMEEGTWELSDGTTIEAGVLNTNKLSTQGGETVALDDAFGSDASVAVLTQTQTYNGGDWVTSRTDSIIEGGVTADQFTHQAKRHSFETEFDSAPTLLTKLDSFDGDDNANSRIQSVDAAGFTAMVIEEQSRDLEMGQTTESLSYLALEGDSGTLSGIAVI